MRSLTVRQMSRGVIGLSVALSAMLLMAGLSIARSSRVPTRNLAVCADHTWVSVRGFVPHLASCQPQPQARRGISPRSSVVHRRRHPQQTGVTSPTTGTTSSSVASPAQSTTPAPLATTPDTSPPQTAISAGPPASTTATTASFTFSSSESGSTFGCKLDGGAWVACNGSPKTYSSLKPGSHQFSVRATDPAGNVDTTPATRSWTITSTPRPLTPLHLRPRSAPAHPPAPPPPPRALPSAPASRALPSAANSTAVPGLRATAHLKPIPR